MTPSNTFENLQLTDVLAMRELSAVDATQVRLLLEFGDLEAKGALFELLGQQSFWNRITPTLTHEQLDWLYVDYLAQCVIEGRASEWCESRYLACYALNDVIREQLGSGEPEAVQGALCLLERLYRHPSPDVKTAVINGCLEHLLEDETIQKCFAVWRTDPELASAYDRAMRWRTA